ncbi:MAG: hypothetical protein J5631_10580 [Spirochaetaceae bacterium]|nr:hypothetical protein [Spirochaetaceae bacterium]
MPYAQAQRFIEQVQALDIEDKIYVMTVLLDSLRPAQSSQVEMDDHEVMDLFDHFTGSMHAGADFDLRAEKNSYLDERYGV